MSTTPPIRGRGASENPPNRFIPLYREQGPEWVDPDDPAPRTRFYRDESRTILATNNSPDIPFEFSLNPYRGCEHGCAYCLGPETPVLYDDLVWRPLAGVRPGDTLFGFDEFPHGDRTRKLRPATVEAVWWSRKPSLRLITATAEIITTAEHRWLDARYGRWCRSDSFSLGRYLRRLPVADDEPEDDDYRIGYVAGLSLGDGTFRYEPGWRSNRLGFPQSYWRVALADDEPLNRVVEYLRRFGVEAVIRPFAAGPVCRKVMQKVEVRSLAKLAIVHGIVTRERDSRSYRRGFLAGFFDAEGSNSRSLRISQVDVAVLGRVQGYAKALGFEFRLERREARASTIRLVGRLSERVRFFSVCRPAIRRKWETIYGKELEAIAEPVLAVVPGPVTDVVDIQTSTGTFFAAGMATHNCYARPTHEYLGMSAGLDFETKILVKEDAPELLRKELGSKKWVPQCVSISGVTDPYQPVERRLQLTRRCLEVFAAFRNPVGIVTKNALVTRDVDVLSELASVNAAAVFLSVTTLDAELGRVMEPRASAPAARLRAIEALRKAGVPVGVMVAPVVPGLTDHEAPAILKSAADAGACCAGYVILRLPMAVADLFEQWLTRHYPGRKDKVLGRVRELRGGRRNDATFGRRMSGEGPWAELFAKLFRTARAKAGIPEPFPKLSAEAFRNPERPSLFD